MTIEDAVATYGVPWETDIVENGYVDIDDLYMVLLQYGYEYQGFTIFPLAGMIGLLEWFATTTVITNKTKIRITKT